MTAPRRLYLGGVCEGTTGWGQWFLWVAWAAHRRGIEVWCDGADFGSFPPGLQLAGADWLKFGVPLHHFDVAITAAGNHSIPVVPVRVTAARWAIAAFFEDTLLKPEEIALYNRADVVICGSTWNKRLLDQAGVERTVVCHQGVDTASWERPPDRPPFPVIFSGGKLEFRKGQDIIVAAFREYLKEDPDAILMTAWQNRWPRTVQGINAMGYVKGIPALRSDGSLDITGWLEKNGVPRRNSFDIGLRPNWQLPAFVSHASAAVFASRAEGGVCQPIQEAMALGIPTAYPPGTGLAEFAKDADGALLLESGPMTARCPLYAETEGWVEPRVEAVLAGMRQRCRTGRSAPDALSAGGTILDACWLGLT